MHIIICRYKQILRKQKQTLEKLRKENETLKDDFTSLQARTTLKPISTFEQKQMDNLVLEIEKYTKLTSNERARISSMEAEITKLRNDIWQRRRYMGGTHAASDNQRVVEKQVKILENRLDQALVRFNKSLAQNKNLRQEIDNLRCERSAFENMYKKLEKVITHTYICCTDMYLFTLLFFKSYYLNNTFCN